MPLPRTSDVNVSVGDVIDAAVLKHTDWVCSWLFANWEAIAFQNYGVRIDVNKQQRPVVVSNKVKKRAGTTNQIKFSCLDNRTLGRLETAVSQQNEVTQMGPYYLACNPVTEQVLLLTAPRYGYDWQPWHSSNSRRYGTCAPRPASAPPVSPVQSGTLVQPGQTSCVNTMVAARLAYLSAYMESSAGESSEPGSQSPVADSAVEFISLTELGTLNAVSYRNRAVVSLKVDHSRASVYRACAKQLPGKAAARLHFISIK